MINMNNQCYVKSVSLISCQETRSDKWMNSPHIYEQDYVRAIEPDSKGVLSPVESRRLNKILKRAIISAKDVLKDSNIICPDAIITGTGKGCMENSEKFLIDMIKFGENSLKPSLFMQSTHNTVSSTIAIMLQCHGYNNTYSHGSLSFVSALLDAYVQIHLGFVNNVLIGSHDEVTPLMAKVIRKTHPEYNLISETSMSSLLSNDKEGSTCEIEEVKILRNPDLKEVAKLLKESDSVLMTGMNDNSFNDEEYQKLFTLLNYSPFRLKYKHLFGDNFSSVAAGFFTSVKILETGVIPECLLCDSSCVKPENIDRITMVDYSKPSVWSIIKIKRI